MNILGFVNSGVWKTLDTVNDDRAKQMMGLSLRKAVEASPLSRPRLKRLAGFLRDIAQELVDELG